MNEILQKRIEEAAENIVEDYNHYQFLNDGTKDVYTQSAVLFMLNEIAQFILSNQWISVEEALPPLDGHGYSEPVFIRDEDGIIMKATYSEHHKKWNSVGSVAYHRLIVTHWMPIPSPEGGEE